MTKYEKASFVINLRHGVDTWNNDNSVYVSVWNAELSDTFDIFTINLRSPSWCFTECYVIHIYEQHLQISSKSHVI